MTEMNISDYFESKISSESERRRYIQNSVIVDTAMALNRALKISGCTQRELADRLGRTEGYVSQVLSGGGNVTLRTLGDFAYGLNCVVNIALCSSDVAVGAVASDIRTSWQATDVGSENATDGKYALAA